MFLTMVFAKKSGRKFKFLSLVNAIDLTILVTFLIRIYLEFRYYRVGLRDFSPMREVDYYFNIFRDTDYSKELDYLYSIISACLWLRVIMLFRLTRFLGPLVKMIQNMMHDIVIFMILFVTQLIVFACIGNLLFADTSSYKNFYTAIKTLFNATMGNYVLESFQDSDKSEYLGHAFLILFIILNNILMLNLLIAILSSTYALLEDKKLVLYINEILKLRPSLEYDKGSSALVSTFPPWNIIALFFSPAISFAKNAETLNLILFHIEYIPLLILLFIVYLAGNILLIPLAYIKGIYVNLQQSWSKKVKASVPYKC